MEIRFVYAVEKWVEMNFEGANRELSAPKGDGHIFTKEILKGKSGISGLSLCGKSRINIGKKTSIKQSRVTNLPVCKQCAEIWKKHPESEWAKYVNQSAAVEK